MKDSAKATSDAPLVVRPVRPQNTDATVKSTLVRSCVADIVTATAPSTFVSTFVKFTDICTGFAQQVVATAVAEAALPIPDQCTYMVRGRRRCRRRAGGCGLDASLCLDHQAATLVASRNAAIAIGAASAAAAEAAAEIVAAGGTVVPPSKKGRKKRVSSSQKRMLNPFSFRALPAEVIAKVVSRYENPCLPLVVDIGAAQGRFLGKLQPAVRADLNFLGVELRGWCVDAANELAAAGGVETQLQYLEGSANNIAGPLLDRLSSVALDRGPCPTWAPRPRQLLLACVQFPDPWSKGKTRRRRIIQPDLADILATQLKAGGFVYASSDCAELALEMKATLLGTTDWNREPCFRVGGPDDVAALSKMLQLEHNSAERAAAAAAAAAGAGAGAGATGARATTTSPWLSANPFGIPSEREIVCEEFGRQVLRALYVRMPRTSEQKQQRERAGAAKVTAL